MYRAGYTLSALSPCILARADLAKPRDEGDFEKASLDSWFLDSWVRRFLAPAQRGVGFGFLEKSE